MIQDYYRLIKPRIIYGNAITFAAGFLLASKGNIDFELFLVALAGISFVIAAGCVFNNYIDRDIDRLMERTKNRALVQNLIPGQNAIIYGVSLGLAGILLLVLFTNFQTVSLGLMGFFVYVVLYSWAKRHSYNGAIVGSIAGAVPPVVGYCAVTNNFDLGALLLFITLCLWQMPHFYAIAIYRLDDYSNASIPTLPVKKGVRTAKLHMLFYIIAFIIAAPLLTVFGYTGFPYSVIAIVLGLAWLWLCIKGFRTNDNKLWAHKMFILSLVIIMSLCITISIGSFFSI